MQRRPSKFFIYYDKNGRVVKRPTHREGCPTCSGPLVPVQRHHEDLGKMVTELQKTIAADRAREVAADNAKAERAKERRERRDKYTVAWIAVLGAVLAALLVGFFGYINKPSPSTPAPVPNIYVNQQQVNQQPAGPSR